MKKLLVLSFLAALTACGTVEGMGRDISDAARGVRSMF
ncbi:hypothetical protein BXY70_0147 [Roseovarius halotolerans]|uniref:Entericidin B membrane lipoprotein n=1 Tax=Roseovarius halotolerans TaxID=505353 RepID=A0A1X6YP02_9RHOB|nr:entericidin EcnA/B family protein [Roseovarius halotolerans]RKT34141.1 hypothetical protein BXY70_0147 [Roseovarius halotolerans]SLN26664.1 entericidin B membrane lipoprotein [Roseovarius halotolerans]